jgi:hypothetical protein
MILYMNFNTVNAAGWFAGRLGRNPREFPVAALL